MSVQQLSVSSFELNPELPDSAFTPDTRLGAQVFDVRNPANVRSYATGDGKAVQQRARELAQSAKEQVTRNPVLTSELSATPAQPRVWIRALLWGSLACLTAACLLRRRLRWLSSLLHRNRM